MVLDCLNNLLVEYRVDRDFSLEIKTGYRSPLENVLNNYYDEKPNYRYGGSLAKTTANSNSCDIDLLCYFDSENTDSLELIYNKTIEALRSASYLFEAKNSAICVYGKIGEPKWDTTVDVVPGKYTSNEDKKDVYLWCNRDKCRLKSNPELQINKVKKSNSKELIRLIKLYREFNNFKFKSFYLEIFAIDVVEPEFVAGDNIYDKLVKFCSHYNEIGKTKIYDPANSANDINKIHNEYEFSLIRDYIEKLYRVLLTNDEQTIKNCILNKPYDIENGFLNNAKAHFEIKGGLTNSLISCCSVININGFYKFNESWQRFDSSTILRKNYNLKFEINIAPNFQNGAIVKLIVSNSGYEALKNNCLRGKAEPTEIACRANNKYYYREETTSYYGNHCVQAFVKLLNGKTYYSDILIVKVR
ncbi:MAG: hypothetical protein MRZ09_07735 [Coprobacillus sp.]|nr:hypothetical protein [Coprobacillus sp.]MCI6329741.1 hypothetical protein [Erysipelotrichaceae bacterium]